MSSNETIKRLRAEKEFWRDRVGDLESRLCNYEDDVREEADRIVMAREMHAEHQKKKHELLEKYADKDVTSFLQYDGFQNLHGSSDIFSIETLELMTGTDVRVLIPSETQVPKAKVAAILKKIADWHENRHDEEHPIGTDLPF